MDLQDFFVQAGKTISSEVESICRSCPVRVPCLQHAYESNAQAGYRAGLSLSQRRKMSLDEALLFVRQQERAA